MSDEVLRALKLVDGASFSSYIDAAEAVLALLGLEVVTSSTRRSCECCSDVFYVVREKQECPDCSKVDCQTNH